MIRSFFEHYRGVLHQLRYFKQLKNCFVATRSTPHWVVAAIDHSVFLEWLLADQPRRYNKPQCVAQGEGSHGEVDKKATERRDVGDKEPLCLMFLTPKGKSSKFLELFSLAFNYFSAWPRQLSLSVLFSLLSWMKNEDETHQRA